MSTIQKGIAVILAAVIAFTTVAATQPPASRPYDVVMLPEVVKAPVVAPVDPLDAEDKRQIQCLAQNVYFEAGNQSRKGMIAVTNVVMNRVGDGRFPTTPCGVVKQKSRGICQFSWVCERGKVVRDKELYRRSQDVAKDVYLDNVGDVTRGAKFYHANYVRPSWSRAFKRTVTIGDHIFYKG